MSTEEKSIDEVLEMRRYIDKMANNLRDFHICMCSSVPVLEKFSPNLSNKLARYCTETRNVHDKIISSRKFIDDFMKRKNICMCKECEEHRRNSIQRMEHFFKLKTQFGDAN